MRLDGKVALITGAARGQGKAEAERFAAEGADVVLADVLVEEGKAAASEIGGSAEFVELDVTSEDRWASTVATVLEAHGRLDVLVNNAGILDFSPLLETTLADYERLIAVNQTGTFLGMRSAAGHMLEGSSIVNISSIEGLTGMPGIVAYSASKFAVTGMTKVAALELASVGIRVNSVHPGAVDTPMIDRPDVQQILPAIVDAIPMGRAATAEDIAAMASFLASDDSRYCTGAEFVVDGGLTAGKYF